MYTVLLQIYSNGDLFTCRRPSYAQIGNSQVQLSASRRFFDSLTHRLIDSVALKRQNNANNIRVEFVQRTTMGDFQYLPEQEMISIPDRTADSLASG